jgi:hypothetical protein
LKCFKEKQEKAPEEASGVRFTLFTSVIHKKVGPLLIKQIDPAGSMGEVVHTSRIKIVREKGPARRRKT